MKATRTSVSSAPRHAGRPNTANHASRSSAALARPTLNAGWSRLKGSTQNQMNAFTGGNKLLQARSATRQSFILPRNNLSTYSVPMKHFSRNLSSSSSAQFSLPSSSSRTFFTRLFSSNPKQTENEEDQPETQQKTNTHSEKQAAKHTEHAKHAEHEHADHAHQHASAPQKGAAASQQAAKHTEHARQAEHHARNEHAKHEHAKHAAEQKASEHAKQAKQHAEQHNKKQTKENDETEGKNSNEEVEELRGKVETLEKNILEYKNRVLYVMAEKDNMKRLMQQDIDTARNFGIQKFAKELLDVSDNLTRALDHVTPADREANPSLDNLFQGVEMTRKVLQKTFNTFGVKEMAPKVGDKFDANSMEALFTSPGEASNIVSGVLKSGYTLNDRVIRPAQVGVTKAVAKPKEE